MISRLAAATVALVLMVAVATGCSSPAPAPEPSPTFTSEDQAFAAAEATYRAYVDALNKVDLSDPSTFEGVYAWTTGDLNASDRRGLSKYHAERAKVSGHSVITLIEPSSSEIEGTDVGLGVCLDVSSVQVVDSEGNSLVDPTRTDVQSLTVRFVRASDSPTSLLINSIDARQGEPNCR